MFRIFPPVFVDNTSNDRSNGNSNPVRIVIYGNEQSTAAVLAQEMREFGLKWKMLHLPAILLAALVVFLFPSVGGGVAAFVVVAFGLLSSKIPVINRWIEYHGHAAEIATAVWLYGAEDIAYRRKEAETMQRGYDGLFKHLTVTQVEDKLWSKSEAGLRYAKANLKTLNDFRAAYR